MCSSSHWMIFPDVHLAGETGTCFNIKTVFLCTGISIVTAKVVLYLYNGQSNIGVKWQISLKQDLGYHSIFWKLITCVQLSLALVKARNAFILGLWWGNGGAKLHNLRSNLQYKSDQITNVMFLVSFCSSLWSGQMSEFSMFWVKAWCWVEILSSQHPDENSVLKSHFREHNRNVLSQSKCVVTTRSQK